MEHSTSASKDKSYYLRQCIPLRERNSVQDVPMQFMQQSRSVQVGHHHGRSTMLKHLPMTSSGYGSRQEGTNTPVVLSLYSHSYRQLYHKVITHNNSLTLWLTGIIQPCLACMICNKRLDSYTLLEHDQMVSILINLIKILLSSIHLISHTGLHKFPSSCRALLS